jgi:flagellar assembly protein FliH
MPETKPYELTDFQEELEQDQRSVHRLKYLLAQAVSKDKTLRQKYEQQIQALNAKHQEELKNAQAKSFQDGKKAGLDEGHKSVQKALSDLTEYSKKVVESEKAFLRNAEKHVITLALAVTKRIIGREAESDREIVIYTVKEALKQATDKSSILIKVNSADLQNIKSHKRELQEVDPNLPELEFLADDKITPGGCVIVTRVGSIDGRISSQVEEIERNFTRNL